MEIVKKIISEDENKRESTSQKIPKMEKKKLKGQVSGFEVGVDVMWIWMMAFL